VSHLVSIVFLATLTASAGSKKDVRTPDEDAAVEAITAWTTTFDGRVLSVDALPGPHLAVASFVKGLKKEPNTSQLHILDQKTGKVLASYDAERAIALGTTTSSVVVQQSDQSAGWQVFGGEKGQLPGQTLSALVVLDRLIALQDDGGNLVLHDVGLDGSDAIEADLETPTPGFVGPGALAGAGNTVWGATGGIAFRADAGTGVTWKAAMDPVFPGGSPIWDLSVDHAVAALGTAVVHLGSDGLTWSTVLEDDGKTAAGALAETDGSLLIHLVGMNRSRVAALDVGTGSVRWDESETAKKIVPAAGLGVGGDTVIAAGKKGILRFDLTTGESEATALPDTFYDGVFATRPTPAGELALLGLTGVVAFGESQGTWENQHGIAASTCDRIVDARIMSVAASTILAARAAMIGSAAEAEAFHNEMVSKGYSSVWSPMMNSLSLDLRPLRGDHGTLFMSPSKAPDQGRRLAAGVPRLGKMLNRQGGLLLATEQPTQPIPLQTRSHWTSAPPIIGYNTRDTRPLDQTPCSEVDVVLVNLDGTERARLPMPDVPNCSPSVAVDEEAGLVFQGLARNNGIACANDSKVLWALHLNSP